MQGLVGGCGGGLGANWARGGGGGSQLDQMTPPPRANKRGATEKQETT